MHNKNSRIIIICHLIKKRYNKNSNTLYTKNKSSKTYLQYTNVGKISSILQKNNTKDIH